MGTCKTVHIEGDILCCRLSPEFFKYSSKNNCAVNPWVLMPQTKLYFDKCFYWCVTDGKTIYLLLITYLNPTWRSVTNITNIKITGRNTRPPGITPKHTRTNTKQFYLNTHLRTHALMHSHTIRIYKYQKAQIKLSTNLVESDLMQAQ